MLWFPCILIPFQFFITKVVLLETEKTLTSYWLLLEHFLSDTKACQQNEVVKNSQTFKIIEYFSSRTTTKASA